MLHRHQHNWHKDIIRYARNKFVLPEVDLSVPEPVAFRTAEDFATRPADCLAAHKARQARYRVNLSRGHFTDQHRPYQNIGDVCLDSHALFCKTLGLALPPKEQHHVVINEPIRHTEGQQKDTASSAKQSEAKGDDGEKTTQATEYKERSGLADIRSYLKETTSRRTAVHGGQFYLDHIAFCKKNAEKVAASPESREMVIQKLSSHLLMGNKGRKYTVAFCPETLTLQIKKKNIINTRRTERKEKQLEERLDAIFMFLTSINNLKSKHLRRRTPLTKEMVMGLRKSHHSGDLKQGGSVANSRIGSGRASARSKHSFARRSNTSKSSEVVGFRPSRRAQRGIKKEEQLGYHTWEDFCPEAKAKAQKRRPWYNFATDRSQSIMRQTLLVHSIGISEQKYSGADKIVQNAKDDFSDARNKLVKTTQDRISKHLRDREANYDLKARALSDLHPLWEVKGREVAKLAVKPAVQDGVVQTDIQETSEWFQKLSKEVEELVDPPTEIQVKLDQLRRFASDGFPFTSVKEKLCLLTVSLPVQEVCTPVIKNALIYVLVEIFSLPRDLLRQWLAYRNITEVPTE